MFVEAILTRDDVHGLLVQALPLTIHLGQEDEHHSLALSDLESVEFVEDTGLRITCKAHVHWPLLGIDAPVLLHSMRVLLLPQVVMGTPGDSLAVRIQLEHADVAGVPDFVDDKITDTINQKLAEKHVELSWNFSKTLAQRIPLPPMLEPLDALGLRAAWGRVRIAPEALVVALSLHTALARHGEELPDEFPRSRAEAVGSSAPPPRSSEPAPSPSWLAPLVVAGVLGATAAATFGLHGASRRP